MNVKDDGIFSYKIIKSKKDFNSVKCLKKKKNMLI